MYTNVKRSQAYHDLDVYARAALFELLDRYTGINNGMIGLGCRELSQSIRCSRRKAAQALHDIDDSGLAHPLTPGVWRGKKATEWQLTFYRCDKTGELPKLNWEPRSQCTRGDAKVHQGIRKPSLSARRDTQERNSSMNVIPFSAPGDTHIDIYQGVPGTGTGTDSSPTEGIEPLKTIVGPLSPELSRVLSLPKLREGGPGVMRAKGWLRGAAA